MRWDAASEESSVMKTRAIGRIAASEIGLGCMGMDHAYGKPAPRSEMVSLLHEALDLGCTLFDTAPVYGLSLIHI